jgi:hypothetical protein
VFYVNVEFLLKIQKNQYTKAKQLWIGLESKGVIMNRRMKEALIGGALLGIICVVGAYLRSGSSASPVLVFSLWYNRVIIGLAVGAPWNATERNKALLRGAVLGLLVSFAFYSSTGWQDPISFVAGIVYGAVLEWWLSRSKNKRDCGKSTCPRSLYQ